MDNEIAGPDAPTGADAPAESPVPAAPTSETPDAAANGAPETGAEGDAAAAAARKRRRGSAWRPAPPQG